MSLLLPSISPELTTGYIPWDILLAQECFSANCGPISFATAVREEITDVIRHFPNFPARSHTTFRDMCRACRDYGCTFEVVPRTLPTSGVALVQWLGPWIEKDFRGRKSLQHTHWIAVAGDWCFDLNHTDWTRVSFWENSIAVELMNDHCGAFGWQVKYGIEIQAKDNSCSSGMRRSIFGGLGGREDF